jgi:NAD(P)-dependent dehydrogenase (short-subunit alcohol dehydrogenase family)
MRSSPTRGAYRRCSPAVHGEGDAAGRISQSTTTAVITLSHLWERVASLSEPGEGPRTLSRPRNAVCVGDGRERDGNLDREGESMLQNRDPREGEKVSKRVDEQSFPGVEDELKPRADHGEESYRGNGRLEGLAAVVTGGDSGIGRAVAIAFAREGADVAIGYEAEKEDEDAQETRRWIEESGRKCILHRFDVREPQQCRELVQKTVDAFGRLDVVVNNAAYQMAQQSIEDITPEQLDRTFRTNIYGYVYMVQAALPHLEAGAVILNTGSVTALQGNPTLLDYSATKGAIHVFTKSLADSLADRGIRVNCVAPGPVWTPLIPATMPLEDVKTFGEDTVWKRPAMPVELAGAYVYLASADARYVTGEVLAVTGSTGSR